MTHKYKTKFCRLIVTIIFLTVYLYYPSQAQQKSTPVILGQKYQLHSSVLDEERSFFVHLPANYKKNLKRYPVLYILDAEWIPAYAGAIATTGHLFNYGSMPRVIVIGICNYKNHHNRDTIPAVVNDRPGSGGSDRFLKFITTELMPHINKSYRTKSYNILYGGSNAGLLTVYAFITQSLHFNACIASSPMIGHCSDFIYARSKSFLKRIIPENRHLFMIYGSNDFPRCVNYTANFFNYLNNKTKGRFKVEMKIIANGGHVPFASAYHGLRAIFFSGDK